MSIIGVILNLTIYMLGFSLISLTLYNFSILTFGGGSSSDLDGSQTSSSSSDTFEGVYEFVNKTALTEFLLNDRLSTSGIFLKTKLLPDRPF